MLLNYLDVLNVEILYLIKLQLRIERENKSRKRVVVFKNFKDKIVIKWKESNC